MKQETRIKRITPVWRVLPACKQRTPFGFATCFVQNKSSMQITILHPKVVSRVTFLPSVFISCALRLNYTTFPFVVVYVSFLFDYFAGYTGPAINWSVQEAKSKLFGFISHLAALGWDLYNNTTKDTVIWLWAKSLDRHSKMISLHLSPSWQRRGNRALRNPF